MERVMEHVAEVLQKAVTGGQEALVGRVIELKGFSTLPVDEMVVIDDAGGFHGDLLGRPGREKLTAAAAGLWGAPRLETVGVEIHGPQVGELGLSCGGRADVLLQPAAAIPPAFWDALAARAAAALVTVIEGPAAGPDALAVTRSGDRFSVAGEVAGLDREVAADLVGEAGALLREGRTASRRVDTAVGVALVEAWVPSPRLVVIGSGDIVDAVEAQAALLGWEVRAADGRDAVAAVTAADGLLDWAGATAALIVCSHDPHVDAPALAAGLARPIPYIGAMGSRATQSRRIDRLTAQGMPPEQLERIHRPIGLNLGGRRAAEVALAIVAEILAVHCGRDGRPLRETSGPIHG